MIINSQPANRIKKNQIFDANYVFIDGMSRSGKIAIAPIVSSFERVEHFKIRANSDRFLMLYKSGHLSKQSFKYLFESDLILDIWFSMMGRDVNNNLHDLSSITNSPKYKEYISRVNRKDTPETNNELINEIKKKKLIFPFVIDNYMTIGSFINEINQNFKYIIVMKNPIDSVFSWYRSGRGTRLGTDPYYIKPSFQINGLDNIHYTMLDAAEEFNHANPLEKCFLIVEKQLTEYLNSKLLHSKNSCLVPFENYSIETEKYIQKFENLLETSRTEFTSTEMIKANLPRKKDISTFSKKINMIFDNMDEKYIHRLKNLCLRYETEISDVYKISSATKYLKGKFKGISIDEFSKVSAHSKYHKGKRTADKK